MILDCEMLRETVLLLRPEISGTPIILERIARVLEVHICVQSERTRTLASGSRFLLPCHRLREQYSVGLLSLLKSLNHLNLNLNR